LSFGAELADRGLAVQEQFLSAPQVLELVECLETRRVRGDFSPARIGTGQSLQRREDIRGDFICWLSEPLMPAENLLLQCFEQLRLQLNREAFLGLFELELHYAAYPPNSGYGRHVDQPRGKSRRQVSLVLYLNQAWNAGDGGELRLFDAAGGHRDVHPIGGRLACFMSANREHCVMPTTRERLSITGWFGTRD
jgi:SM-20-related protein